MTKSDENTQHEQSAKARGEDDRRGEVNPADNPAPRSPEAEAEAVREGEEKLSRVKAY